MNLNKPCVSTNENSDKIIKQDFGINLDCTVVPVKNGLYLVQTTDFLYPIVDDPFIMGQIACANVLSDIYALGIYNVDNLLIILGVPCEMNTEEINAIIPLLLDGFNERGKLAGCNITGGDTKENMWLTIGGVATSVIPANLMIKPTCANEGDSIILTKPLGTNAATTLFRWLDDNEKMKQLNNCITKEEILSAYCQALQSMTTLNQKAASLMHRFNAHAATDITGYGLIGHAENLVKNQINSVDFIIDTLPIINYMHKVEIQLNNKFKLLQGKGIETSGGLFICLPSENVQNFINTIKIEGNIDTWLIGKVVKGSHQVKILEPAQLNIINVS